MLRVVRNFQGLKLTFIESQEASRLELHEALLNNFKNIIK